MTRPSHSIAPFDVTWSGTVVRNLAFPDFLPPMPAEYLACTDVAGATPTRPWTVAEQSQFIESLYLRLPVPPILTESIDGTEYVLRGHQRVEAVRAFFEGRLRLAGLQVLAHLNGRCWADLDETREGYEFENAQLPVHFIRCELTPAQRAYVLRHFRN